MIWFKKGEKNIPFVIYLAYKPTKNAKKRTFNFFVIIMFLIHQLKAIKTIVFNRSHMTSLNFKNLSIIAVFLEHGILEY